MFGANRSPDIQKNLLQITEQPRSNDWQLGQVKVRGKVHHLNEVRIDEERRQQNESQRSKQEYHRCWGPGRGTVVERVDAVLPNRRPGHSTE